MRTTASVTQLAASVMFWSLALGSAAERWVSHVEDWTCGSYDTSADDLTLDSCVLNCAGYAYMAYWWGGQQEGHCGCTDSCEVGAATAVSSNEHNMLYKSATARSTHQDTWGIYRKDWSCTSYDAEAAGLDLEECLSLCGDAGSNYTMHWWGGLNQGRCRCGSSCDDATATDTGNNEHNAVYKMASKIQETWALVKEDWLCDPKDKSPLKVGLEACADHCSGSLSMSHWENSNNLCRCSDSCFGGKEVDVLNGYTNKVYRVIPLQTAWVEYKANHECKQFYSLRSFSARKDLASCMELCSSHPFLIHRSYGSSGLGACQCMQSCESPTPLSSRSTHSTAVYKSVPVQMLYPSS